MKPMQVATAALKTTWNHKSLWAFGVFVGAAGAGGAGRAAHGKQHVEGSGRPACRAGCRSSSVLAVVIGVLMVIVHAVCEIALIDGVRRSRLAQPVTFGQGVSAARGSVWRLIRVKLLGTAAIVVAALVVAVPAGLHAFGLLAQTPMLIALVPLVLAAVPVLLSIFFINTYALRICVLESKNALASFREARQYLSGRVLDSLNLTIIAALGSAGSFALTLVAVLPAAALGGLAYLAFGLIPAVVIAGLIALPLVTLIVGATGTFGSAVWTIGYLEGRAEEAA